MQNNNKHLWIFTQTSNDDYKLSETDPILTETQLLGRHPKSVYTTTRSYERGLGRCKFLHLDDHLRRLAESCALQHDVFALDSKLIKKAIDWICTNESFSSELRIKIIYPIDSPLDLYFFVEELTVPTDQMYLHGVKVITHKINRNNPKAKTLSFIKTQENFGNEIVDGVNEVLRLDENSWILEGLSSNFFGIIDNEIYTAKEGILEGITRKLVIEIIHQSKLSIVYQSIKIDEIGKLSECFITSTSRGILPVTQIDQSIIGDGQTGKITYLLYKKFQELLNEELETL